MGPLVESSPGTSQSQSIGVLVAAAATQQSQRINGIYVDANRGMSCLSETLMGATACAWVSLSGQFQMRSPMQRS